MFHNTLSEVLNVAAGQLPHLSSYTIHIYYFIAINSKQYRIFALFYKHSGMTPTYSCLPWILTLFRSSGYRAFILYCNLGVGKNCGGYTLMRFATTHIGQRGSRLPKPSCWRLPVTGGEIDCRKQYPCGARPHHIVCRFQSSWGSVDGKQIFSLFVGGLLIGTRKEKNELVNQ
jgi:hypothetical protein